MKKLSFLLAVAMFYACTNAKQEPAQIVTATPTGLAGLQKQTAIATVPQPSKSNLIFNPPHGEAGHTCALAVGAPLNNTAVAPQPQQTAAPQPTPVSPVITNITGKNLNPKHGEPKHRCDIAVGAPLNSKPVQVVKSEPIKVINADAKLNPKHGEPNHRCDIAVGAPLT
ncbi:hypothetical protein [Pedobacter mucosus]|uniref:hypothetical protein n=1 Tax=Pedobacter mucosus TaxID=2895286 RepID=UPI001EE401C1|nr:hypothetical protein [Pedobacter mucosus]UKT63312.1 hypothetical protein LOK61_16265 [Pedobacter mucosus]